MHGAEDVVRPPVEVPSGPDVEGIPRPADQRGGTITVVAELELATVRVQVTDQFRIGRHLHDIERQPAVGVDLSDLFLEEGSSAEPAGAIRADEIAPICRLRRVRETEAKEPVARGSRDRSEGEYVRPHSGG